MTKEEAKTILQNAVTNPPTTLAQRLEVVDALRILNYQLFSIAKTQKPLAEILEE